MLKPGIVKLLTRLAVLFAFTNLVHAQLVVEVVPTNLNPPGFVPVNGLTVAGVTFTDTTGATYDSGNGGNLTYTQDPVIEGQTGGEVLTASFPFPVYSLQFGFALSTQGTIPAGATVMLFAANGNLLGTYTVPATQQNGDLFSNGHFTITSGTPIAKIVVTFNSAAASAFGFGNLALNTDPAGAYQISYAANLNIGDSVFNLSNDGTNGGFSGTTPATVGNICVNVYTFDPSEEEISCCACLVTPDGLKSLSAKNDLINDTLTSAIPTSILVKFLASVPGTSGTAAAPVLNQCNPAATGNLALTGGMKIWGTTLEPSATLGTYGAVSVPTIVPNDPLPNGISTPGLSASEFAGLTTTCNFIQSNGTGFGICGSCALGALSGTKQ